MYVFVPPSHIFNKQHLTYKRFDQTPEHTVYITIWIESIRYVLLLGCHRNWTLPLLLLQSISFHLTRSTKWIQLKISPGIINICSILFIWSKFNLIISFCHRKSTLYSRILWNVLNNGMGKLMVYNILIHVYVRKQLQQFMNLFHNNICTVVHIKYFIKLRIY